MTKAWKVVYDTLSANDGWAKGMALRSTGTDGVLFIENPEKTDGFTVVRMMFAAAGGVLLSTVNHNADVLRRVFSASDDDISTLKEKIRQAWL